MTDPKTESEILFTYVKEMYGNKLTEQQLQEVKGGVEKIVEASLELRKVKLENSDEPFSMFIPYRGGRR
jgi:hypothetical protein